MCYDKRVTGSAIFTVLGDKIYSLGIKGTNAYNLLY